MRINNRWLGGILALMYFPMVLAVSPEGTWTTVDDKTGNKRADVRLTVANGTLNGTIIGVHPEPGDKGMWGLKEAPDGTWEGGHILDAKTGKIYRVKMTVKGDKLYVRGYVGVSLLGRTQVWVHG